MGESQGNNFNSSGGLLTSPKGAQAAMQVMPGTATNPGFGVRPAADNSPQELNRVGMEYRAAMQARYGNDPAKMWAAYNWGPGHLDHALANYGDQWMQHAPQETRNYVGGNMKMLKSGAY